MKRLLLLLALCVMVVSVPAAFTQNFQDTLGYTSCYSGTCVWYQNITGGNSYMSSVISTGMLINSNPEQTTYAAISLTAPSNEDIQLLDSGFGVLAYCHGGVGGINTRHEVSITGGYAHFTQDGVDICAPVAVGINPSYIGWNLNNYGLYHYVGVDDLVYGTTAQRVVYGMPEEDIFVIKKDMLNPASAGLAFKENGTIVSSTYMTSTWSRSAVGATGGTNESIVLANVFNGNVYATKYTGSKNTSTEYWDIATALINSGAPYGEYETYIVGENGAHSTPIRYIGMGASVAWDRDTYSQGETATISHSVADGGYWNTGVYNYKLAIMDGNTGQFVHNESMAIQAGNSTYTFTTSDLQGEYYAIVIATVTSTGQEVWMNYDWASMNAYFTMYGWANGAETNAVLSGVNISVVQGSTVVNQITTADGNYTATGFLTGSPLVVNVTKGGYSQYYVQWTPATGGSKYINLTLNSTTPTVSGIGIGGVARTGVLTGDVITLGYGQPIEGATCYLRNQSNGDSCTNVTNMAAWYKFDAGNGCILTSGRVYDVWCQKAGYANSPNYTVRAS